MAAWYLGEQNARTRHYLFILISIINKTVERCWEVVVHRFVKSATVENLEPLVEEHDVNHALEIIFFEGLGTSTV